MTDRELAARVAFRNATLDRLTQPGPHMTDAERHFDALLAERRAKGRQTYGKGLDHSDPHDWQQMALEEALDLAQYLAAENLRLRERLADKDAAYFDALESDPEDT